jgi:hypothetical protein
MIRLRTTTSIPGSPTFADPYACQILGLVLYPAIGRALGRPTLEQTDESDQSSRLYRDVLLLIEVANGAHDWTDAQVRHVELALTRVRALLVVNVLQTHVPLPEAFWQTNLGVIVSRASWWVLAEDLITISNAAALAFGENNQANRMHISRAINSGVLDWVPEAIPIRLTGNIRRAPKVGGK